MTLQPPPLPGEKLDLPAGSGVSPAPPGESHFHESISTIPILKDDPPPRISAAACMSCGAPLARLDEPCLLCKRSRLLTRLTLAAFLAVTVGLAGLMLFLVFFKASTGSFPTLPRWPFGVPKEEVVAVQPVEKKVVAQRESEIVVLKEEKQPPVVVPEQRQEVPVILELSEDERALKGDSQLQLALAERYYRGDRVPRDYAKALSFFELAGRGGNVVAMMNAAVIHEKGEAGRIDQVQATRWYRMAAEHGNPVAQNRLAIRLFEGEGTPRRIPDAVTWYRRAAEQRLPDAQYNLGILYFNGEGVPRDLALAHQWIGSAASAGNVDALYWLGQMYVSGTGVAQNLSLAETYLQKAAQKGHPGAAMRLQELRGSRSQRENGGASISNLQSRAQSGDRDAQYKLGVIYDRGDGVARNAAKAVEWYTIAAKAGVPAAQERLGIMHMRGEGTQKDLMTAYIWLKIAAGNGQDGAETALEFVSEQLSDANLRMARALAEKVKQKIRSGAYSGR